ncbi:MAG: hypothetical protein L6V88_02810 [Anaerotruncus sp.]|nr:MAG: hypothetical protein L6V88_02810 [Anaerotruncus sp.]
MAQATWVRIPSSPPHLRWAIRLPQFLFISHSTILILQQKNTCGGQFACRSFFIYISPDNIDFAAKNTPAVGNSNFTIYTPTPHKTQ